MWLSEKIGGHRPPLQPAAAAGHPARDGACDEIRIGIPATTGRVTRRTSIGDGSGALLAVGRFSCVSRSFPRKLASCRHTLTAFPCAVIFFHGVLEAVQHIVQPFQRMETSLQHTVEASRHTETSARRTVEAVRHAVRASRRTETSLQHTMEAFRHTETSIQHTAKLFRHTETSF